MLLLRPVPIKALNSPLQCLEGVASPSSLRVERLMADPPWFNSRYSKLNTEYSIAVMWLLLSSTPYWTPSVFGFVFVFVVVVNTIEWLVHQMCCSEWLLTSLFRIIVVALLFECLVLCWSSVDFESIKVIQKDNRVECVAWCCFARNIQGIAASRWRQQYSVSNTKYQLSTLMAGVQRWPYPIDVAQCEYEL